MPSYCSNCGSELSEGPAFCPECGEKTKAATADEGGTTEATDPQQTETSSSEEGVDWSKAGIAAAIAILPAFGAYMLISLASNSALVAVLPIGIAAFGYLLYKRPTSKAMFGGALFWLAVEAFLSPLFMILYTFAFAAEETSTAAGSAGAAIGGGLLTIVAFVVGLPLGVVFYLFARKLDVDEEAAAA
jgi:hypothetical protein